jgi:hypothetical protein
MRSRAETSKQRDFAAKVEAAFDAKRSRPSRSASRTHRSMHRSYTLRSDDRAMTCERRSTWRRRCSNAGDPTPIDECSTPLHDGLRALLRREAGRRLAALDGSACDAVAGAASARAGCRQAPSRVEARK